MCWVRRLSGRGGTATRVPAAHRLSDPKAGRRAVRQSGGWSHNQAIGMKWPKFRVKKYAGESSGKNAHGSRRENSGNHSAEKFRSAVELAVLWQCIFVHSFLQTIQQTKGDKVI